MGATNRKEIKNAGKEHTCSWCGERIPQGSTFWRWRYFDGGDASTVKVHPECLAAGDQSSRDDPDWDGTFDVGAQKRGHDINGIPLTKGTCMDRIQCPVFHSDDTGAVREISPPAKPPALSIHIRPDWSIQLCMTFRDRAVIINLTDAVASQGMTADDLQGWANEFMSEFKRENESALTKP